MSQYGKQNLLDFLGLAVKRLERELQEAKEREKEINRRLRALENKTTQTKTF